MARVLIVDDDPGIIATLKMGLKAKGYEVDAASDGLEAVQQAMRRPPDFIILDFHMPCGGGTTAYEALRELGGSMDTPILFLTAVPIEEVKDTVSFRERTYFLAKPAGLDDILRVIEKAAGS